jgi:hypothetical protein
MVPKKKIGSAVNRRNLKIRNTRKSRINPILKGAERNIEKIGKIAARSMRLKMLKMNFTRLREP